MRKLAVLALMLALVGCATITKGTTQTIAVDTPGVPGATCTIQTPNGPRGLVTPGNVALDKQSAGLPITCTKECYTMGSSMIPSNTEAMAAGNVLLGGVVGLGVDAATGAMNKYPDLVTVAMLPDPACGSPRQPRRRDRPKNDQAD
jgi:phosphoketolase